MSEQSHSPALRSTSPRLYRRDHSPSPRHNRLYSPRSTRSSSSRSYSRSRSRSRSYSRRRRSRSRSHSYSLSRSRSPYRSNSNRNYHHYYSRSPPHHHRRSPPPRHYRSRTPPPHYRRRPPINKGCRVYVSNLSFDVTWPQLKDFMREAGQVTHVDILKLANGRSKGCGIVEYRYPEDAKRAIHMLNEAKFMGRPVFVREDRDYEHSGPPRDPHDAPDDCRLHVSNLPLNASWQDMKDLFRRAGRVLHTDVHTDIGSRRPNGHGTVIFDEPRFARTAIEIFNGYEWQGHRLEVKEERYMERLVNTNDNSKPSPQTIQTEISINGNHTRYPLPTSAHESLQTPPPQIAATAVVAPTTTTTTTPTTAQPLPMKTADLYNIYRYGGLETANALPPPPLHHPHLPPPPPLPLYATMGLVGGPAANLPTHGHNQIFVNNLPFSTTWQDLIDLFRHVGPVIRSEILTTNGHPKGAGFVRFEDAATCEKAIERFNGYMYGGRCLDIRLDKYSTTI
ncbi:uncharacterized protein BX663DRAFT_510555 [Cokeromyces recurvatus]|uniref:uncharacterized protein n=1 Tax=Cokeromyces recurvatus TaxID=90255 RepID=UPI00221FD377|nr:uncharacterized protein BX663DRAFT_510555 [Cokeromyces recurvatus]KAI7902807.1 hypothetical protein BX663DRAFT_510555 [Cokeromyces recurvatus]